MSNIDLSRIITAEARAAAVQASRRAARKAECRQRILDVMDELTQINLAAAASLGVLDTAQVQTYRDGLTWMAGMRAAAGDEAADWPPCPEGLDTLAAAF